MPADEPVHSYCILSGGKAPPCRKTGAPPGNCAKPVAGFSPGSAAGSPPMGFTPGMAVAS